MGTQASTTRSIGLASWEMGSGILWTLCIYSQGMLHCPQSKLFTHFTTISWLPSSTITSLVPQLPLLLPDWILGVNSMLSSREPLSERVTAKLEGPRGDLNGPGCACWRSPPCFPLSFVPRIGVIRYCSRYCACPFLSGYWWWAEFSERSKWKNQERCTARAVKLLLVTVGGGKGGLGVNRFGGQSAVLYCKLQLEQSQSSCLVVFGNLPKSTRTRVNRRVCSQLVPASFHNFPL